MFRLAPRRIAPLRFGAGGSVGLISAQGKDLTSRHGEQMETTRRSALRLLTLMLVGCVVLPLALFGWLAWTTWASEQRSADERLWRALDVLHEHTLKVFQTAELLLLGVDALTGDMSDAQISADAPRLHLLLSRMTAQLGERESIWIVDRNGHPLVTSLAQAPPPGMSLTDRDFFVAQAARDSGTYVGAMAMPKLPGGRPFFALARRRSSDEAFAGIVVVTVDPAYLESFYADLGDLGNYFALIRQDGGFLARFPPPPNDEVARATGIGPEAVVEANPVRGIYTARSTLDGVERRVSYRRLDGYPVYILAGIGTASTLAEWLTAVGSHLVFDLPVTALLIISLLVALRRTRSLYDEAARRGVLEEELRHTQRMEAIGQLTGGVAHDFNNLLLVILGTVELLRRASGGAATRGLDTIEAAVRRGERLTRQLLSFARRQTLAPQPVDLGRRIVELSEMLKQSLRGDIQLAIQAPDSPCAAMVDVAEFELALLNLAVNARDAMPHGGRLSVAVYQVKLNQGPDGLTGSFVAVAVTDTGAGIPREALPRVFDPFFTTKEAGKGTGLGLSQVYGFARQSGGTATIDSVPGCGTAVTLYLAATDLAPAPQISHEAAEHDFGAGRRVLLVEDNSEVAEVSRGYLEQLGFAVRVASDAEDALGLIESTQPDAVLSDIVMPGAANGLDLALHLRQLHPELPVVLATGYSASAEQARREGFTILRKPYDLDSLALALRSALARRVTV